MPINMKVLAAINADQTYTTGVFARNIYIRNDGTADVQIDFDRVTSSNSYLLTTDESVELGAYPATTIHYRTNNDRANIYVMIVTNP